MHAHDQCVKSRGIRAHLCKVLVVVGVGIASELGPVDHESEKAHVLWQVDLCRLVCEKSDATAWVRTAQDRDETGVRFCQLVLVMALQSFTLALSIKERSMHVPDREYASSSLPLKAPEMQSLAHQVHSMDMDSEYHGGGSNSQVNGQVGTDQARRRGLLLRRLHKNMI